MALMIGHTISAKLRISELIALLDDCPLVASVFADKQSPLDDPEITTRLAEASLSQGVRLIRLEGIENILAVQEAFPALPIMGCIKGEPQPGKVYVSAGIREVQALIELGCEVICLDGTPRPRPGGATLPVLIQMIHAAGRIALADCDSAESAAYAVECGADVISTMLSGYTVESAITVGPDLDLIRRIAHTLRVPVLAEGRYSELWEVEAALRAGAAGVVVGAAINDPIRQTRALMPHTRVTEQVGAIEISASWLRFGLFSSDWRLIHHDRVELPETHEARMEWIESRLEHARTARIGIASDGVIDPRTGIVSHAKELVPDLVGHRLTRLGSPHAIALNDGLTTAWGHACLPQYAGRRVATLTLGTGVGCGFVTDGRIVMGRHGEYPRIHDLRLAEGHTLEDYLGGAALTAGTTRPEWALGAARIAVEAIETLYYPDLIVLAGGVGASPLMRPLLNDRVVVSPFGEDAGLYGAAALALFPPRF